MSPLRVNITNCVLLNGGDAAIVEATIAALSDLMEEPVEFTVFDQQADVSARHFPDLRLRPWPWQVFCSPHRRRIVRLATWPFALARASVAAWLIGRGAERLARPLLRPEERSFLTEYASADLVLSKGGTYLVEHYRLAPHIFDFRLASLLRKRLVLAPQSLGPFTKPTSRAALRRVLARATVYVRDERSRDHLLELGLPADVIHIGADTAFAAADPAVLAAAKTRQVPEHPRVAVSVRDWPFVADPQRVMARYREAIAALVTHVVREHGAQVTFLSTCQGVPEYVTDDSAVARTIADTLPADVTDAVEIDGAWLSPPALRERVASFDLAVATRMHFGIVALAAGVPVLPIAYEFKTNELFRQLGLSDFVQDLRTIDPEAAVAALDRFVAELASRRAALFDQVEDQRVSAISVMREIARQLERA